MRALSNRENVLKKMSIIDKIFCLLLVLTGMSSLAHAQPLAELQYHLYGLSLEVSPGELTVPRGITTQVNTSVVGIDALPSDAVVYATLRGPSFPGTIEIQAAPGGAIQLPPLSQPGPHFLEDIRLEVDSDVSLAASPNEVTINVLEELLVGDVTSRPLSLQEIQEKGIEFDENSYKAFSFTLGLMTESEVLEIELPVLVPVGSKLEKPIIVGGASLGGALQLPDFKLPYFTIEPIMLEPITEDFPEEEIPPIPGILVIPGNIAFLNQFFSVLLVVSNEAPDGTPLVVENVQAEIFLPSGDDNVSGDILRDPPFEPGEPEYDNPLRIAKTDAGRENIKAVLAPGADDKPGTEDDVDVLAPQASGTTEFLVEGVREGGHIIEIEMRGTLMGLPSGPVEVAGRTSGAVVVRDPDFSLTFIHPDTVRAGERYELTVHIQNTSQVAANLVTVSLDPRNLSGARLMDSEDAVQLIETIPAGESGTATFPLEALRTGQVTATTLELSGEDGIVTGRHFYLKAGVSEQGVPLSPDTLLLPPAVSALREATGSDDLTFRAVALLGEAHSIATAPRGSLPPDVHTIGSDMVIQRALELTEAGVRLELSYLAGPDGNAEPLSQGLLLTLEDFFFDFLGEGTYDEGWDVLYRKSRQARLLGAALADVVKQECEGLGIADLLGLQSHWAGTEEYRGSHVTVMIQSPGYEVPVILDIMDGNERHLGGSLDPMEGNREIPGADLLGFYEADAITGQFAVITNPDASPYTGTLKAFESGTFDLGIVVAASDGLLRHVVFQGISVLENEELPLTIRPGSESPVVLLQSGTTIPPDAETIIPDNPPHVLGVVQDAGYEVDSAGRVVAVLFSEDIDPLTAQNPSAYGINPVVIPMIPSPDLVDGNDVTKTMVQFGERIVFVGLRDPIGPFVRRTINISGVQDLNGQAMAPVSDRWIMPDPDIGPGAQVSGRVMRADGSPVSDAEITYFKSMENLLGLCEERILTQKAADENGGYELDFVEQQACGPFRVRGRDPVTGEEGSLITRVRNDGERLRLDIVLVGRGAVEGTVRDETGTPVADATVSVKSMTDFSRYGVRTDQNGFFRINGIPVGPFGMEVVAEAGSSRVSGTIAASGATATVDVTLFSQFSEGVITGEVLFPDNTKASDFRVILAKGDDLLDASTTDSSGTFRFENVPVESYRIVAMEAAAGLIGEASISVTLYNDPENPAFVRVILGGTGTVSGTVFERDGTTLVAVPGAVVSGGTQIVTADAEGHYLIPTVPVGQRTVAAMNPETGAEGSRTVTILAAGQVSTGMDIVVEPLGTVTGRVFDTSGEILPNQEVRIVVAISMGTYWVRKTQTAADGTYRFDNLTRKEYPLVAVRGSAVANGTARLSSLVSHDVVDLTLIRPTGAVSGIVMDESGLQVAAGVTLKARMPNAAGILEFKNAGTTISDPDQGFVFEGLFPGPFTVTASSFFSPQDTTVSGYLPEGNPVVENITLILEKNTATLSGCVLDPDGTVIEPIYDDDGIALPLSVFITSKMLRDELERDTQNPEPEGIRVDASDGCYVSSIPLPPDYYTVQVTDDRPGSPWFGHTGQAKLQIAKGDDAVQDIRLLGLGSLAVEVVDATGQTLQGVEVTVRRTSYPCDASQRFLTAPTDVSPAVFQDLTEGSVMVSAFVSTDPEVDVGGRDDLRGYGGSASGVVLRDALRVVRVSIRAAGTVSGRFVKTDGVTPVPNAQVELYVKYQPTAFDVTDEDGYFEFVGIPVGPFTMEGFDPSTGRRGNAAGQIAYDGQDVVTELQLGPIGTVKGVVVDATRTDPVTGAEVRLRIGSGSGDIRVETSGVDGTVTFESVPSGDFTLKAVSLEGLSGQAEGSIGFEGEVVEREVVLEGNGRVTGSVFDDTGAPVSAAEVTLKTSSGIMKNTQAETDGESIGVFVFESVPMGSFTIEARPPGALTPGDGGVAQGKVEWNDQTVTADVNFQGTISVGVVVTGKVVEDPVEITLDSGGVFGGRAYPTEVIDDVTIFEGIPRAPFTVSARQVSPVGTVVSATRSITEEDLPAAGTRLLPDIELVLSQVATIQGIVTDTDGAPVSAASVAISAGSLNAAMLTDESGTFEFVGIPLDQTFSLEAEGSSGGLAKFSGRIDETGVVLDSAGTTVETINMILDVEPPVVLEVMPLPGEGAVPTDTSIVIHFSESLDINSLTTCSSATSSNLPTFRLLESSGTTADTNDPNNLCDDSNVVPVDLIVSEDGTSVTLFPLAELKGDTMHTVIINRGTIDGQGNLSGGLRDLVGLPLEKDYVWQFTTRDNIPPSVVIFSPENNAIEVSKDSVFRITFNEPINPASVNETSVLVQGPSGPITGQLDLTLGNTVVVFTPTDESGTRVFLEANAVYTMDVTGITDPAGNVLLLEDEIHTVFGTVDTIPPVITSVSAPSGARSSESIVVIALTSSLDVKSVEFFVDGVLTAISATPSSPGEFSTTLVMPERSIQVAARAVDQAGNVGALSPSVSVSLLGDEPPSVIIASPNPDEIFSPGSSVSFTVEATDDVAVAQITGTVSGAVTAVQTQEITPPVMSAMASFSFDIPSTASEGTLTFSVYGTDNKGQAGALATIQIAIQDQIDPVTTIISPAIGETVFPGIPLDVVVEASDSSGVAELSIEVPEIGFMENFTVSPPETSSSQTFTIPLPDLLEATELTLVARATDRFGRQGVDQLTMAVWNFEIDATALRGLSTDPSLSSANTGQTIVVSGKGLNDSLRARFTTRDDGGNLGTETAPLFGVGPDGLEGSVMVPATADTGPVHLETGLGDLLPGEVVLQIVPTLDSFSIPDGEQIESGVVATIGGSGFCDGGTSVEFPNDLLVAASDVFDTNTKLTVTIPDGTSAGELFIVTDGGMSNGFPILGTFGVVGSAAEGSAIDPVIASANPGQSVTVTGETLSTSMLVVFSSTDDAGTLTIAEAPLTDVTTDGTQASVVVPANAVTGTVKIRPTGGEPFVGETFIQIVPKLTSISIHSGEVLGPGTSVTLLGEGFRIGETEVIFSNTAPVTPDLLVRNALTVIVPDDFVSGHVSVQTDGGVSRALALPGTFGIVAAAAEGVPANTAEPSANTGQILTITGENIDENLVVVFQGVDDDGTSTALESPLTNIATDGLSASVTLPLGASTGTVYLKHSDGVPTQSNVLLQVVPTLSDIQLDPGSEIVPGEDITLVGSGLVEGQTEIDFPGAGRVVAKDVFNNGQQLLVTIPQGIIPGSVTVITTGGTSDPVQLDFDSDLTPPVVVEITPNQGATDVPINTTITVRFSEPVSPESITTNNVYIEDLNGPVDATIQLVLGDTGIVLRPTENLQTLTNYTIKISDIQDQSGNIMDVSMASAFITSDQADVEGPVVLDASPEGDGVAVNSIVVIEFNEAIDPASINEDTFQVWNYTTGEYLAGSRAMYTDRVFYFIPAEPFAVGTQHRIYIREGVEDVAGNPLDEAYPYYYYQNFTTSFESDTTPPELLAVDPGDGDQGVAINARITVQMSESVDPISVTSTTVVLKQGDTVVSGTLSLLDGNRRIQFVPTVPLAPLTDHTLVVSGLKDVAGNLMTAPVEIHFTTKTGADLVSPQVVSTNPSDDATGVVRNVVVTVMFSEPVNPNTVDETAVQLRNQTTGQYVNGQVTMDESRTIAIMTPSVLLDADTQYRLQINNVVDTSGNIASLYYGYFTTVEN
ncbi:Ig-like domain-containing protein [Desulfosarcina ovata]|uniref:SbsA Ig-like domain-containing protein n=1 Tax=Desulfosarcina ovata subsp. ovata TaxID=2752305 RepID=A0A5K8A4V5_9BACT|nr:Ig-like domain-containing protein [Desulfosarcina ovata]BBO87549.1 hypothetical protein DSCOOX_07290 [Desulfosarcina ovata subsp. ovata]